MLLCYLLKCSHDTHNVFCSGSPDRIGMITARHVGVPDLDQRFTDFAEMFNTQQENYECMQEKRKTLMVCYCCAPDSSLSECLQKMKDEHSESEHVNVETPAGGNSRSGLGGVKKCAFYIL